MQDTYPGALNPIRWVLAALLTAVQPFSPTCRLGCRNHRAPDPGCVGASGFFYGSAESSRCPRLEL
jgi:hypothetical protein